MLKAKRNSSTKTDSDDEDCTFDIKDSVSPPSELTFESHINSTHADVFANNDSKDDQMDLDHLMKELFSSINLKSQKIKRQLTRGISKTQPEVDLKVETNDFEVDLSRCDEDEMESLNESVVTVHHMEQTQIKDEDELSENDVTQLVKDLQAKHSAEKEVLKNDIQIYKSLIRQVIAKYKTLLKQKQKSDIKAELMKKLQDVNKSLKETAAELSAENLDLAKKFGKMKELVLQYEANRVKQFNETEVIIKQLTLENLNLRRVLTLGKENYDSINLVLREREQQNIPVDEEMPIEVQQMMLDRMDEVQAKKEDQRPNLDEDEEYLAVFKNQGLGTTLNGSQMARLKKMFEDHNLQGELQGTSIKDDLEELYGNELPEVEDGEQPS